jgi:hypothetical protein
VDNEPGPRRGLAKVRRPGECLAVCNRIRRRGAPVLWKSCPKSANDGRLLVIENLLAGLTTRFLRVLGGLYATANYLGQVDVGLSVTGLEGALSSHLSESLVARFSLQPYDRTEYRSTERFTASTLAKDPQSAARKLVLPPIRVVTREQYDPFST